jgi:predicted RNA-binding protein with PIN domain
MPLLIDGYNLLHVSGVFGRGTALTELHRSREALLAILAASLEPAERTRTTIVFDAAGAPPGLPQEFSYEGINVQFARDPGNADELLEKLIEAHDAPRKLVVVSGDHRVQRAARRRRATAIDSDLWWADLCAERRRKGTESHAIPHKPTGDLAAPEVDYWLAQFAEETEEDTPMRKPAPADEFENPFPPGYGDDLLDEAD